MAQGLEHSYPYGEIGIAKELRFYLTHRSRKNKRASYTY